jgi:hypothetical protein
MPVGAQRRADLAAWYGGSRRGAWVSVTNGQEAQVTRGAAALGPVPEASVTRPLRHRDRTLAVPPVVTLAVMLRGITTRSSCRDESAALSAADRCIPQLPRMPGRVDAVHDFYYLLLWPAVYFAGTGELRARLRSAIAVAGAAPGSAVIGRLGAAWRCGA